MKKFTISAIIVTLLSTIIPSQAFANILGDIEKDVYITRASEDFDLQKYVEDVKTYYKATKSYMTESETEEVLAKIEEETKTLEDPETAESDTETIEDDKDWVQKKIEETAITIQKLESKAHQDELASLDFEIGGPGFDVAKKENGDYAYKFYFEPRKLRYDSKGEVFIDDMPAWSMFQPMTTIDPSKKTEKGYEFAITAEGEQNINVRAGNMVKNGKEIIPVEQNPEFKSEEGFPTRIYKNIYPGVDLKINDSSAGRTKSIIFEKKPEDIAKGGFMTFWEEIELPKGTKITTDTGEVVKGAQTMKSKGLIMEASESNVLGLSGAFIFEGNLAGGGEGQDIEQEVLWDASTGKLKIGIKVPHDFLLAENRVYPVTVDPTFTTCVSGTNCRDDLSLRWYDQRVTLDHPHLYVGYGQGNGIGECSSGTITRQAVLYTDFSSLAGQTIQQAKLWMRFAEDDGLADSRISCGAEADKEKASLSRLKQITTPWTTSNITYQNVRGGLVGASDGVYIGKNTCQDSWCSWSIYNNILQGIVNNPSSNQGFLVDLYDTWATGTTTASIPASWKVSDNIHMFRAAQYSGADSDGSRPHGVKPYFDVSTTPPPKPDLRVTNSSLGGVTQIQVGASLSVSATVRNVGTAGAGSSTLGYYLSPNTMINTTDVAFTTEDDRIPALAINQSSNQTATLTIPATTVPGNYYIGFRADKNSEVSEINELHSDNVRWMAITVVANPLVKPDLTVTNVNVLPTVPMMANTEVSVDITLRNIGTGPAASAPFTYFLSTDNRYSSGDTVLRTFNAVPLDVNKSYSWTENFTLPSNINPGSYYLLFAADHNTNGVGILNENNETNNILAKPITVVAAPDLAVSSISIIPTSSLANGETIHMSATIKNNGNATATASTQNPIIGQFYYSEDGSLNESSDYEIGYITLRSNLAGGAVVTETSPGGFIPISANAGTRYIFVKIDDSYVVTESNENNNVLSTSVSVHNIWGLDTDRDGVLDDEEKFVGTVGDLANSKPILSDPQYYKYRNDQHALYFSNSIGDPINASTGAFDLSQTDLKLPSEKMPMEFTRTYNSRMNKVSGRFGNGWSNSFNIYAYTDPVDNSVQINMGGGFVARFTQSGSTYVPAKGQLDYLKPLGNNRFEYKNQAGIRYQFTEKISDSMYAVERIYDANNNRVDIDYMTVNNIPLIRAVNDNGGRAFEFNYGTGELWDKVVRIDDYSSNDYYQTKIYYEYDSNKNLVKTWEERQSSWGNDIIEKYFTYDSEGRMTSSTDPNGTILYLTYDSQSRVTAQHEFNPRTDAPGTKRLLFELSYSNGIAQAPGSTNCTTIKNYTAVGVFSQEQHCFDTNGQKIYVKDGENLVEQWAYNSDGLAIKYTDPNGGVTEYGYDTKRRKIYEKLPNNGFAREFFYTYEDTFNRLTEFKETFRPWGAPVAAMTRTTKYKIDPANGNVLSIEDPLGNKDLFDYDTYGNVVRHVDKLGKEKFYYYGPTGHFLTTAWQNVTDTDGVLSTITQSYEYGGYGQVRKYTDPKGIIYSYDYDNHGNVRYESFPVGGGKRYTYDKEDHLILMQDELGRQTRYTYDKNLYDNLIEVRRISTTGDIVEKYEYNFRGDLQRKIDPVGNVNTYTYDKNRRLVRESTPADSKYFVYDSRGNLIEQTNALEQKASYKYDAHSNVVETRVYSDATNYLSSRAVYDGFDRAIGSYDAKGNYSSIALDLNNRLTKETARDGGITTYSYDAKGNLLSQLDPRAQTNPALRNEDGASVSYKYDELNRVVRVKNADTKFSKFYYDPNGNLSKVIDRQGFDFGSDRHVTQYEYNTRNWKTAEIDAYGKREEYVYTGNGLLKQMKDRGGNLWNYTYDHFHRLATETDPEGKVTSYAYDANSNLRETTYADGTKSKAEYDSVNRKVKDIDPLGFSTIYRYDTTGNLIRTTDKRGNSDDFVYDKLNRLISETNSQGTVTQYTYDPNGNTLTEQSDGKVRSFVYDNMDRLTQVTHPGSRIEKYQYDVEGNLTKYIDGKSKETNYQYDGLNRITNKQVAPGRPEATETTYNYDNWSNPVNIVDTETSVSYNYDLKNRLMNEVRTISDLGARQYTIQRAYDDLDRLIGKTDAAGRTVAYTYSTRGQLDAVKYNGIDLAKYTHNNVGLTNKITYGNGIESNFGYDAGNRMTSIATVKPVAGGSTENLFSHGYSYDAEGNRTGLIESSYKSPTARNVSYGYDSLSQLTTVDFSPQTPGADVTFAYDKRGNRTTADNQLQDIAYSYNAGSDELKEYTVNGNLKIKSTHDANGAMETVTHERLGKAVKNITYEWNDEGELEGITYNYPREETTEPTLPDQHLSFKYDENGNRIKKEVNGKSVYYINDGLGVLNELDSNGNITRTMVRGEDAVAEILGDGSIRYMHQDSLGSTVLETDETGKVVSEYEYDPFGGMMGVFKDGSTTDGSLPTQNNEGTRYLYTNQEYDIESDLYYYNARYYNPAIGRFLSRDPVWGSTGNVLSKNPYVYVQNNPLKFVDPTGMIFMTAGYASARASQYFPTAMGVMSGQIAIPVPIVVAINSSTAGKVNNPSGSKSGSKWETVKSVGSKVISTVLEYVDDSISGLIPTAHAPEFGHDFGEPEFYPLDYLAENSDKILNGIQLGLDGLGLVPIYGEPVDFLNGVIYTIRGDELNAGLSFSATVPAFGAAATTGKWANKSLNAVEAAADVKKGTTVLGSYDEVTGGYVKFAKDLNANYFDIPPDVWKKLSPDEKWAANKNFLDETMQKGYEIVLSDKVEDISKVSGTFRKELDYLADHGYQLSSDGRKMIKP